MTAPWILTIFLIFSSNTLIGTGRKAHTPNSHNSHTPLHNWGAISSYLPTTADLSTTWINDESSTPSTYFKDGVMIRPIFEKVNAHMCGFFCIHGDSHCTSYLFAILVNPYDPVVIWSANRDNPVSNGAILNFTEAGELVLHDADGSKVWTTNTNGKSAAGMKLKSNGNLVLFDVHKSTIWQSFDHPTDCLVAGQKLYQGQKLIPSVSSTDWTAQKDSYSLQLTDTGLFAYVQSDPPQVYHRYLVNGTNTNKNSRYAEFLNGNLSFFNFSTEPSHTDAVIRIPLHSPLQYMKLMPDGHLKVFEWQMSEKWREVANLLNGNLGECFYPLACGRNLICAANKHCSCPGIDSFQAVNDSQPNLGCFPVTPLTCNATQDQDFIELENVKYFTDIADMKGVDVQNCKQACRNNCSCKAALFEYDSNSSSGNCYLLFELFTMSKIYGDHTIAYIKVQNGRVYNISQSHDSLPKRRNQVAAILGSTIGSFVLLLIVVIGLTKSIVRKLKINNEMEEEYLDQVLTMPNRFSYEELKIATHNFSKKLGQGGYGSVFEGTLEDGSRIAVKCLEGLVHVKKSFLAEVESIGNIHHVNLVRLVGFCAWRSQRLLVYELMSNRSLDQWIYYGGGNHVLKWQCRKKIILDVAKGLAYLHEDCRQKIIHLDIKPQNILLDEDFNAKVSDFGLSKLIERDQSQVITTMRGTPGYMAPEWLSSIITEKVDVYSFGIVVLEILCGRKNFDTSQPEESWHLLHVFQRCWEQGSLLNIVEWSNEEGHDIEVLEMIKVASWCLQTDFTRRPSMSEVIKVLEGVMDVESNLDYNFTDPRLQKIKDEHAKNSKTVFPSFLSGPR